MHARSAAPTILSTFRCILATESTWTSGCGNHCAMGAVCRLRFLGAIYHWLKYSHASWVAFPAIAAHLFISFALMSYALSGTGFFATYLP